jgi:hypothetical protein
MRAITAFECAWEGFNAALLKANNATAGSPAQKAALTEHVIPARAALIANGTAMITYLQQTMFVRSFPPIRGIFLAIALFQEVLSVRAACVI